MTRRVDPTGHRPETRSEHYRFDVDVVTGEGIWADELVGFVRGQGRGTRGLALLSGHAGPARSEIQRQLESLGASVVTFPGGYHTLGEMACWLDHNWAGGPADWIVAVGGGRVVDAAKILSLRLDGTEVVRRVTTIEALRGALDLGVDAVPTCVVPTVAGSGAESSMSVDILVDSDGVRSPVAAAELFVTRAVLDGQLLRTVPDPVAASALVQSLMRIMDPWLNAMPVRPVHTNLGQHLMAEVVRLARLATHRPLSGRDWLRLATINQLSLRPGLARTSEHVANIHRIEHALEHSLFPLQGSALTYIALRMLRWVEAHRSEEIASFAVGMARVFNRDHLPSHLLQTLVCGLTLPGIDADLSAADVSATLRRLRTLLSGESRLPGNLGLTVDDVGIFLAEPIPPQHAIVLASRPLLAQSPPHPGRIFGRETAPRASVLVVTPVPAVFDQLEQLGDAARPAWYPTTTIRAGSHQLIVLRTPVGRSALVDALDLAIAWLPAVRRAVLLGLAATLISDVAPSTSVRPGRVLSTQGLHLADEEFELRHGSADWCVASVDRLSDECSAEFEYLRWRGAQLIDLESAAFCQWCAGRDIEASITLSISDDVGANAPIWALDQTQATVIQSGAVELVNDLLDSRFWL